MSNSTINDSRIKKQLENWWNFGKQDKPLLFIQTKKDNTVDVPDTDNIIQYWTDINFIIDRDLKKIQNRNYFGVAMPYHYIDFSASAMPCAFGGGTEYKDKNVLWCHPVFDKIEDIMSIEVSENNTIHNAIIQTTKRSCAMAKDRYYVSPWPLSGIYDTIAALYGTENLLIDMIEQPDKVKAAADYMTELWIDEFNKIIKIIDTSGNDGHICSWVGIWAPGSTFPIQEDISYMMSPEMFREFCVPCIRKIVNAMKYPLYHLDGIGAAVHVDALLEIEELKAIQWQPGAGKEEISQWYSLIKKIIGAGKACQVFVKPDEIDDLVNNVGTQGLLAIVHDTTNLQAEEIINRMSN